MAENQQPDTPEKQLLRLIENPKQPVIKMAEAKRESKKWFSINAMKGRVSFWSSFSNKKWFSFKKSGKSKFGIKELNLILKLLIVALIGSLIYYGVEMSMELKRASNLILQPDKDAPKLVEAEEPEFQALSYFQEKIASRNLFGIGEPPEPEPEPGKEDELTPREADRAKDFKLVGIAWSNDPEAMIEDIKSKRTYFLKRGQPLDDNTKVTTIFKDKVMMTYKGKEFELR